MLTTFDQVRDWIRDNGFKRWVLYKDRSKTEKILDSAAFPSEIEDKLAMTEKYLRYAGGSAYAAGGGAAASDLSTVVEIRLADVTPQGAQVTAGVGGNPSMAEIEQRIEKQVRAEIKAADYERREKDLEKREKEFNEKQNGVIGALVNVFAPYLPVLGQVASMRNVAGIDTVQPIMAQPIVKPEQPQDPQEPEEPKEPKEEESPFTDEEADELFTLMADFKKVEPEYLKMLRKVVQMAKSGDTNYQFARKVLVS